MITEIKSSEWPGFCQRVSQERAGAMVKIETVGTDGSKKENVPNATLQGMKFDGSDGCNDVIRLQLKNDHEFNHEIVEPIHILLHPSKTPNDFNPIEIAAENGVTFITFHPAIHASMLEGLKVR